MPRRRAPLPLGAPLLACALLAGPRALPAQAAPSLADLRWAMDETAAGRFTIATGERGFVGGYNSSGLEVWTYPLQVLRGYRVTFRVEGDTAEVDGRTALRRVEHTPSAATRVYEGPGFSMRERLFVPAAGVPGAAIRYAVTAARPVLVTVHFTPSLNLMWPAGFGGQETHWDSTHSAYMFDEPARRFRGAVLSRQIVAHDAIQNNTRGAEFDRPLAFTLRVAPGDGADAGAVVAVAGSSTPAEDPLAIAQELAAHQEAHEARARERYANLDLLQIDTPDTAATRAIRWAQVTLEQAWACNPQLGCGLVAGYGPSRGVRRPQYAWFFAGDGLVAARALLREGAYRRARDELAFVMRYQHPRTGAVWHEMSQSAGFLNWGRDYPYMYAHVDISFDFLDAVGDYVQTTGDLAFARAHWAAVRAAYAYCRSTVDAGDGLPHIPPGKMGGDEQDPLRDELTLSLAWVRAAGSFAELARLTGHAAPAAEAARAAERARRAIRPAYYDRGRRVWVSGHLHSGAPVEGLTNSAIELLHAGLLDEPERGALLDRLASPAFRAPWGVRSTATDAPEYDPDSYSRGSVWALGTASAALAFAEAGRPAAGAAAWRDLVPWFGLDAPGHMHELMRGDAFTPERESVPDQTWSAAAFLSGAVRGVLGLDVDGLTRRLRLAPRLPAGWDRVAVRRIHLAGADVGLALRTSDSTVTLDVENAGPAFTLRFRPGLTEGARVAAAEADGGVVPRVVASEGGAGGGYEVELHCLAGRTTRLTLRLAPAH